MVRWLAVALVVVLGRVAVAEPLVMDLYPGVKLPSEALGDEKVTERGTDGQHNRSVSNVTKPSITVYLPPAEKNTGAAVIICPGGGYRALAIDKEGYDVAQWLNTAGVAGIVLKYRMPNVELTGSEQPWPLQDAHKAITTVREKAKEWRIDPKRVGIMGFSAGGHLAATAATHYDAATRPDFAVLVYPVITFKGVTAHSGSKAALIGKDPDERLVDLYSNELHVNAQTPPTLLVHAEDDGVKCENSLLFFQALRAAKVPTQLLLYVKGGHGFGLAIGKGEPSTWPDRCLAWMTQQKIAVSK